MRSPNQTEYFSRDFKSSCSRRSAEIVETTDWTNIALVAAENTQRTKNILSSFVLNRHFHTSTNHPAL